MRSLFGTLLACTAASASAQLTATGTTTNDDSAAFEYACEDTHVAASLSQPNVQSALNAADANDCVELPAGSAIWTSGVSLSVPSNLTVYGAGDLGTRGGGDATVITDNIASTSQGVFEFTYNSDDGYFRFAGVTVRSGTGSIKESGGMIEIGGTGQNAIVHHITVDASPASVNHKLMYLGGYVEGVIYESVFSTGDNLSWIHVVNGSTSTKGDNGDTRWDDDTAFGTADFIFLEDNDFIGRAPSNGESRPNHGVQDCHTGGKHVTRFNSIVNTAAGQTHPTAHSADDRGCRAHEIYGNVATSTVDIAGGDAPNFVFEYNNSGPAMIWGNSMGDGVYSNLFYYNNCRSADGLNCGYNAPFGGWQTCGARSVWDGNRGAGGYPCLDQPGRGKGDLINGGFPSKTNVALRDDVWPRQALEAVYEWSNTGTRNTGWGGAVFANQATTTIVQNRDFYHHYNNSSCNAGAASCAAGVGVGTLAQRPANCTASSESGGGVAFWVTDEGEWNSTNGATADGRLYRCSATNTWSLHYTPYTYPHPLRD